MTARSRPAWIAALLVFLTAGYFQNSRPGWNVNSQYGLTLAIVERGTMSIDDYHARPGTATEDKAYFNGRFYCDKSPVTAFLGVPAFAAYRLVSGGGETDYNAARYWTTWGSVGVGAGALAFMLTVLLTRAGAPGGLAAAAAALWIAGTPLIGYSILFFNYTPACAFAVAGYLALQPFLDRRQDDGFSPKPGMRLFSAGLLVGLACWTLPTVALLAMILTLALLSAIPPRRWVMLWPWAVGGILGTVGYAIYSMAVFGEITSPYRHEFDPKFKEAMSHGIMGAGWPRLDVMNLITLHPYHGLFVLFPCTLLAAAGAAAAMRDPSRRRTAAIALAFLGGLVLYNSGYFMWWGGMAYAPRHLIPALPLLAVGMAPFLRGAGGGWRRPAVWIAGIALIYSAVVNIMAVSLDPQTPAGLPEETLMHPEMVDQWPTPFFDLLGYVVRGQTDFNWGTGIGLSGLWSLLPLGCIWVAGLAAILWPPFGAAGRPEEK